MSLLPFSAPIIDERFRVKLAFDTNLLMYLLDNSYPNLSAATLQLNNHKEFIDLITNRYTLFELYEKRKEAQFVRIAATYGFGVNAINSDKFSVHNKLKYERVVPFISFRKLLGSRLHSWISRIFTKESHRILIADGLFFKHREEIMDSVKVEIPKIKNDFGIDLTGTLHDALWIPTFELIFTSRISREDSLITVAFLKPDNLRTEKNLIVLTNDGDFRSFYHEAKKRNLILPLFQTLNLSEPTIDRITELKRIDGSVFNLRSLHGYDVNESIIDYVKNHIIQNNEKCFLGITDETIAGNTNDVIGFKLKGTGEYSAHQNIIVVGRDLDFLYQIPYSINEFRNSKSQAIDFPLKLKHDRVCFKHIPLDAADPDKQHEVQILTSLKRSGNLVFVHPDTIPS